MDEPSVLTERLSQLRISLDGLRVYYIYEGISGVSGGAVKGRLMYANRILDIVSRSGPRMLIHLDTHWRTSISLHDWGDSNGSK